MLVRVARFYGWSPADVEAMTWRRLLWWDVQADRYVQAAQPREP